jgi:hypothetical protein
MTPRRAITLIEMLVASGVFLLGFVGALSLFTAGVSFRKQSDDLTRSSLALTSLVEELRIDAGREAGGPWPPAHYVGDGFAANGPEDADLAGGGTLFPYRLQPGIWYRVESCTDLAGNPDHATATAIRLSLLVIPFATTDETLTLVEIGRRLQQRDDANVLLTDPQAIADRLVQRGNALRHDVVLVRQRSW